MSIYVVYKAKRGIPSENKNSQVIKKKSPQTIKYEIQCTLIKTMLL